MIDIVDFSSSMGPTTNQCNKTERKDASKEEVTSESSSNSNYSSESDVNWQDPQELIKTIRR